MDLNHVNLSKYQKLTNHINILKTILYISSRAVFKWGERERHTGKQVQMDFLD